MGFPSSIPYGVYSPGVELPMETTAPVATHPFLDEKDHRAFQNRLARLEGQIRALHRALDEGACADDLILLASAARGALGQFIARLLEVHLVECATHCMEGDPGEILRRVTRAVSTAMKQS